MNESAFDILVAGGTVIDPAAGRNGRYDVGIRGGRIAAVEPDLSEAQAAERIDVSGKLVLPGMIDTHAHVYEHVTGKFGLNADMVGVRSAVTTLVDQGGPSCMTIGWFRNYVADTSKSRVLCSISCYLVGGLEGHPIRTFTARTGSTRTIRSESLRTIWTSSGASRRTPRSAVSRAGASRSSRPARRCRGRPGFPCTFISGSSGRASKRGRCPTPTN